MLDKLRLSDAAFEDTSTPKPIQIGSNLEHIAALMLHQSLLVIGRLTGPIGLETGRCFLDTQEALSLLIHKTAADPLHIGQVHTHQLPAILRVQTSEGEAGPVSAASSHAPMTYTSKHA